MASSLRRAINDRYVDARGIDSGIDQRLSDADVYRFMVTKSVHKARAIGRGFPQAFIARDVRLVNRSRLRVGRGASIGSGVLIDALAQDGIELEDAVTIDTAAVLRGSGGVRRLGKGIVVRKRAAVGAMNFIHGGGGVDIGEDVLLGPYVQIHSENHVFEDPSVPIIEQGEVPGPVHIGRGVWVGASSVILANVTIGEGAVIAAGSVVTHDIPAYAVAAGVPARVMTTRGSGA